MTNPNMRLWDKVKTTNPRFTKEYTGSGGFKGTAIGAQYRVEMATEQFGPLGIGWGYDVVDEKIVEGVWIVRLKLWYMLDGQRGEVTQYGANKIKEQRKGSDGKPGYDFLDEEAPKKSITDALTKCLSLLGFNADVHLGKFDSDEYYDWAKANAAKQEGAAREAATAAKAQAPAPAPAAIAAQATPPAQAAASTEAPPANATIAPAGSGGLNHRQQANVWFLKLRKLNEPLANSLNTKEGISEDDRCKKIGAELANCLWSAIHKVNPDLATTIKEQNKGNLSATIDALLAAQPKGTP